MTTDDKPHKSRTDRQPFRGASLPTEMVTILQPTIDVVGQAALLRAMTLAWMCFSPQEQAEWLARTQHHPDAVTEALRATTLEWPTADDIRRAKLGYERARRTFDEARDALTELELKVLRRRLLDEDRPSLDDVAHELGDRTRQHVHKIEQTSMAKLGRWLIALLGS